MMVVMVARVAMVKPRGRVKIAPTRKAKTPSRVTAATSLAMAKASLVRLAMSRLVARVVHPAVRVAKPVSTGSLALRQCRWTSM